MKKILFVALLGVLLLSIFASVSVSNVSASSVKEARKHAEETLLHRLEWVSGIGSTDDPPRIIVYIESEKYRDRVPSEIMGVKTVVKVTGRIKALALVEPETIVVPQYDYEGPVSRTGVVRPLSGGISLGIPKEAYGAKMAGTLSVVTGDSYILSCAHVIAMDKNAKFLKPGTAVLQPGTYDGGTEDDKVGELHQYIEIRFGWASRRKPNYADAAIATLTTDSFLKCEVLGGNNRTTYTISGTAEVNVGDTVRKSGRTTGVTQNVVTDTAATVRVYYTWTKWAIFADQILVQQPFIEPGDSGSLVDIGCQFVGLAYAGSSEIGVVCKAGYIVSGLGITV